MNTSKIIKGAVSNGRYTVTAPIVKEDYGLYLQIEGVELPSTYEVDFSNSENSGSSVTMIGNADGVLIPRQFISTGKDVFAFLYHVGADYGRTVYKFRIPNKVRPDRTNEEPTPEEQSTIDQAISALNSAVAATAQDVIDAAASASAASQSESNAHDSELAAQGYAQDASGYASNAQGYATTASQKATAAGNSADQAAQIKTDIEGYVSTAQTAAQTATDKAAQASQSATNASNSATTASTKAGEASASATTASNKASEASGYATTASDKATEASGYANTASQKAIESAQSASQALTYKNDAESAKTASQTAQGLAEQAQTGAETAQGKAEDAQAAAESVAESIQSDYSQLSEDVSDLKEDLSDVKEDILYNPTITWEVGGISQGQDVERNDRIRTVDHLPLSLFDLIEPISNKYYQTVAYKADGTFLGTYPTDYTRAAVKASDILSAYPSANYIRIIGYSGNLSDSSLIKVYYSFIKENAKNIDDLDDPINKLIALTETSKNVFTAEFKQGTINSNTGFFTTNIANTNTAEEEYIPIIGGKTYVFSWANAGLGDQYMYVFPYTEDKGYKGASYRTTVNIGTLKYKKITFDSDVAYIRISVYKSGTANWENLIPIKLQIELGTFPTYYLENKVVKADSVNLETLTDSLSYELDPVEIDKVKGKFQVVAYSKLYDDPAPINSKEHFEEVAKMSFDGIKGDIAITSDGYLIMCHDLGYTFDANGKITTFNENNNTPIRNLTYVEVKALAFAQQYNGQDVHPADIDDFLFVAKKYGKFPYIVIRNQNMDEIAPKLVGKIYYYGLETKAIINSFTLASIQAIRAIDRQITLSQVTAFLATPTIDFVDTLALMGNTVLCIFDDGTKIETNQAIVDYAKSIGLHVWVALQINNSAILDDYVKAGYCGAQSMVEYLDA